MYSLNLPKYLYQQKWLYLGNFIHPVLFIKFYYKINDFLY